MSERTVRLMVVDDEEGVVDYVDGRFSDRAYVRRRFGGIEFAVKTCGSGQEALEVARVFEPEVVLLDVKMPGLDGVETLRRLKAIRPQARVLMVTSVEEGATQQEAALWGAQGYITKPLKLADLERAVEQVVQALLKEEGERARQATRQTIDYKQTLEQAAREMVESDIRKPTALVKLIVRTLTRKVGLTHAGVVLMDLEKPRYVLTVSQGAKKERMPEGFLRIDANDPLITLFTTRQNFKLNASGAITRDQLLQAVGEVQQVDQEVLAGTLKQLEELKAEVACPGYFGKQDLLGVLLLGKKLSGDPFTQEELTFFMGLTYQAVMAIRKAQMMHELEESYVGAVEAINVMVELHDQSTGDHLRDSERLGVVVGRDLEQRLGAKIDLFAVRHGSRLHDVGKYAVAQELIQKKGPLSREEWQEMKKHPEAGARILKPLKRFGKVAEIVFQHHERPDGTGYPRGLKGEQILMETKIVAAVDAYLAMTTQRSYNVAKTPHAACQELLRCAGTEFDPQVVASIIQVLTAEGQLAAAQTLL